MFFTIPATNIASISGISLLTISSSLAFESFGSIRAAAKTLESECLFVNAFKVQDMPDTGILNCELGEVCVEDETSSLGGRCASYNEEVSAHRQLGIACQYSDGRTGVKCQGYRACSRSPLQNGSGPFNLDNVGCGSCIGDFSCLESYGKIDEHSCRGTNACRYTTVNIGYNSCNAPLACMNTYYTDIHDIGDCFCNTYRECYDLGYGSGINRNYNNCPTKSPSMSPPTLRPTISPSSPPSSSSKTCATIARKVKIESSTGEQINLFSVKVISTSGVDETKGVEANATQSSTYRSFGASNAIDSNFGSFSHTNDNTAWWQVDMGKDVEISSVDIINRWCREYEIPNNCLCRLSGAKLSLLDANGNLVSSQAIGDACSKPSLKFDFDYNCESCLPNASKLKLQSNTGMPLNLLEVEVYSAGVNVAANKNATSSSTFRDLERLAARAAVDEDLTSFSVNGRTDSSPWWEVDLGNSFDISKLKIFNRLNENISTGGLCNLSQVGVLLLNARGEWIDATFTGDTCGLLIWEHIYESMPQYCLRNNS